MPTWAFGGVAGIAALVLWLLLRSGGPQASGAGLGQGGKQATGDATSGGSGGGDQGSPFNLYPGAGNFSSPDGGVTLTSPADQGGASPFAFQPTQSSYTLQYPGYASSVYQTTPVYSTQGAGVVGYSYLDPASGAPVTHLGGPMGFDLGGPVSVQPAYTPAPASESFDSRIFYQPPPSQPAPVGSAPTSGPTAIARQQAALIQRIGV